MITLIMFNEAFAFAEETPCSPEKPCLETVEKQPQIQQKPCIAFKECMETKKTKNQLIIPTLPTTPPPVKDKPHNQAVKPHTNPKVEIK